jgi:CHC2 zinc finger
MLSQPLNARELKARVDLAAIAGQFTRLRTRGHQFVGLCPLHSERHPSFYVHPVKQCFKCFGCGAGGDLFEFIMRATGCDFLRALHIVAEFSSGVVRAGSEMRSCERRTVRLESFAKAASRIAASLPGPGFVPVCWRCFALMAFRVYRRNRFRGVYFCSCCSIFFGPKELRAKLFSERGAVCQWCSAGGSIQMHHVVKRGNQYDPGSIVLLCLGCHGNVRKLLAIHQAFERRSREAPSEAKEPTHA